MASTATPGIGLLIGPIILALVLSALLYGCALVQTYTYSQHFPRDKRKFKALVAFEIALQTVHIVLLIQGVWDTIIANYSNPHVLLTLTKNTVIGITFGGPSALSAQAFFIFRLYAFSRKILLPIICTVLVIVQLIFTLAVGISAYNVTDSTSLVQQWQWFITFGLYMSIAGDTTIALGMSHYLRAKKTGFKRTSRLIDRMVLYIVATGVTTSLTALAAGVSFSVMPNNYVWLGLFIMESGLYTNSLLAAMNSRAHFSQWHDSEAAIGTLSLMRHMQTTDPGMQDQEQNKIMLEGAREAAERESDKRSALEVLELRPVALP